MKIWDLLKRLYEKNGEVLGTRASAAQFEVVKAVLPEVRYDAVSRLLTIQSEEKKSVRQERPTFPLRRKRRGQQSFSAAASGVFLMRASADCTVCWPKSRF